MKWRAVDVEKHNMKWKPPCRDEQMFLSFNPSLYPPLRHEISEGGINTHIHTGHFPVGRFSHIDRRCCDEGFSSSMLAHQWFRLSRNLTCLLREEEEEVGETNKKIKKYIPVFQNLHLSLYLSLFPLLACIYLNNAWDLVLGALPLSVCLFKINRFMYSPIVSRFG